MSFVFSSVKNAIMSCVQVAVDLKSLDLWMAMQQHREKTSPLLLIMAENYSQGHLEQNVCCTDYMSCNLLKFVFLCRVEYETVKLNFK